MKATDQAAASGAFKTPAKADKVDATTRAAREIIDRERVERDAKTARLRALRLAKEADDAAIEVVPKKATKASAKAVTAKAAAAKKAPAKARKAAQA